MSTKAPLQASLAVALAGVAWGLFWLPLRRLEEIGIAGGWASLGFFIAALPVILPILVLRRRQFAAGGTALAVTGAITGLAFTCYALSLLLTEVVRALLLFYVTPLWGTLLTWLLLGERLTHRRAIALVLAFAGLVTILGTGLDIAPRINLGDGLGLASGILWAYSSLRIYRVAHGGGIEQASMFFIWAAIFTVPILLLLPAEAAGSVPALEALRSAAPYAVAIAGLIYLPAIALIFWGATHLDPGRVGLLMMGEIVVGVASAAWLTDEPFGLREALGTAFILGAALVEVIDPGMFGVRRRSS